MKVTKSVYKKMLTDYPDVMRVNEICAALGGISRSTCYNLFKENRLHAVKCGRSYIVTKLNVIEYLMKENNEAQ